MHSEQEDWNTVIGGKTRLLDLKLKQVWAYRDLLWLFVRRDFVSFYKQTILGPLWFFIQPIITTGIYVFLFRNLAKLSTDGLPGPLFYIVGITIWTYFSETLLKISTVLRDSAAMFGKVYFPRLITPLSIVFSNLFKLGIQMILLLVIMSYFAFNGGGFQIPWQVIFFPVIILLIAMQALGLGMIVAALASKYRDLAMLLGFGLQLLMYAGPVVYPLSSMTGRLRLLISCNPMTAMLEASRFCLLGKGTLTPYLLLYSVSITIIIFFAGIVIYNRAEKSFIDTV